MRAVWQKYFEDVDVFLSPTSFVPAYPHDHSQPVAFRMLPTPEGKRAFNDSLFWIHPATLTGCPAVSAPVGLTASGLPVGLQIMSAYLEDPTAIEFAAALAGVVGGFQAPKGYE
jgi:amidase